MKVEETKREKIKTEETKETKETKETESNKMGVAKSMRYLLKTIWRADKGCVIYAFYKNCTEEIFGSFFYILLLQMIYSYIESASSFRKLVIFVGGFCLGHICIHLASAGYAYYIRLKTPKVYAHIFHRVIEKAGKIGLTQFEKPDFYDKYAKALDECLSKAMDGLGSLTWAIGCALSAIAAMALIARVDPVMLCFSVPPIISSFYFGTKINHYQYMLRNEEARDKRTAEYVKRVFYEKKYASEIRLYPIRNVLFREHRESYDSRYETYKRLYRKINLYKMTQGGILFGLTVMMAYLYVAFVLKTTGAAKIGLYVATLGSIDYFSWRVKETIKHFIEVGKDCMYMNNLQDFLELEEESTKEEGLPVTETLGTIMIDHMSFTYAGAKEPTIRDLSLHVEKGERIALVGENGAGKTTFVKLLMGLYPVTEGSIKVNGTDIMRFDKKEYHRHFGTVFQDLQVFALPLSQNVLMKTPENEEERRIVKEALVKAQFGDTLQKLPDGIDSMVTKEFDEKGFVCSGGQAQKIAIARVFAKNPDIVILDEPSSALDPIAEYNMYHNMMEAAEGKTVFFISHRLSSARLADRILFLEHGRIVESGTHEELMALDGRYAEMFRLQAGNYKESVSEEEMQRIKEAYHAEKERRRMSMEGGAVYEA